MYKLITLGAWLITLSFPIIADAACKTDLPYHIMDRYVDNGDGTVNDSLTGLTWMRCPLGRNWDQEKRICDTPYEGTTRLDIQDTWNRVLVETQNLNQNGGYAGITTWRVPNIKELASLIMLHCYPPIDTSIFPDAASKTGATKFWSSTPSRKIAQININKDKNATPIYQYHTQAWTFSLVDNQAAGKAAETPTHEKHHVMLISGDSATGGR
ncbi:MAG: DUF1566 domain-containing protein [Gammaproteobacteria bacterium]|nr:DUF1566 domain-containing protein [Gammaproteobacteria bacterium]